MTRNEIIAAVKELGIKTERPAHQMKTEALQALLDSQAKLKLVDVKLIQQVLDNKD